MKKIESVKNTWLRINKDPYRKKSVHIITDVVKMLTKTKSVKSSIKFYTDLLLYKKDAGKLNNYLFVNNKNQRIKDEVFFKHGKDHRLKNKVVFSKYMRTEGLPTAEYIGEIKNKTFIGENGIPQKINSLNDLKRILFKKLEHYQSVFIKPSDSNKGKNTFKVTKKNIEKIKDLDLEADYIAERAIKQHRKVSEICSNSINTLRVVTYQHKNNVKVLNCIFRMGMGQSIVDNASAGGIFIDYDINENKLDCTGYTLFEHGGKSYIKHPDTKVIFKNKSLPFPKKVKKLVIHASRVFDVQPIIGWDIAYTPDGPIIIEGNNGIHIGGVQITEKGLLNNSLYSKIFEDFK